MYFQPEIETMSREELLDLQLERMKWCVQYAYDNVPFYQKSFKDAGVEPGDLKTLEDITKFPFILKQDMRDNYPDGLFAVPRSKVARLHASSGTTGQATVVGSTENDLKHWGECFARGLAICDCDENATMQIAYGYGLFTGGLGAHRGGETAGCAVIPISSGNTKRQIQMLKDMEVDVLACTPSYALHIADTAIEMGINPATDLKVRAGIFGAEPCSQGMRDEIAEKLGVTKPSVVRVLNLLMERGMIVKEYYGKIYLTDRGIFVAREVKKQLDEVLAHFPPVEEELSDEERLTAALALTAALPERVFTGRYDQLMGAEEAPSAAG